LAADHTGPDGIPDGIVDQLDYNLWKTNFGNIRGSGAGTSVNAAVPEPAAIELVLLVAAGVFMALRVTRVQKSRLPE
jgi:hypothetical protein